MTSLTHWSSVERMVPWVEEEGILLLECPIGSHGFVNLAISKRRSYLGTDKLQLFSILVSCNTMLIKWEQKLVSKRT